MTSGPWKRTARFIHKEYRQNAIVYCGLCYNPVPREEATADHIIPRVMGGTDAQWNLEVVHLRCNKKKGAVINMHRWRTVKQRDAYRRFQGARG